MMNPAMGYAKYVLLTIFFLGMAVDGFAQDDSIYLSSRQPPVRVSVDALYQTYSDEEGDISEFSIPLVVSVPIGRSLGLSVVASQATVSGDTLASVSGLSDAQVGLSYYRRVGRGSVVASFGVNLPSGKRELTVDEFVTSIYLSRHFYNFRVPGFGQGLNLAPGLVVALPVTDNVVVGIGASYQVKGGYRPQEDLEADFTPGDELLLTGGLDVRVNPSTNLSADVTYTRYDSDALGDSTIFNAGDKVTATVQWLSYFQAHELRLVARLRSQAKSSRPAVAAETDEELRTLPAQQLLLGRYRHRVSARFILGLLAQGRFFGETDFFEARTLFDVGLGPEVVLSDGVALRTRFIYTLGDFTGFEVGGGLVVEI